MKHGDDRRRFLRSGLLAAAGFTVTAEARHLLFARSREEGQSVRSVKLTKQAKPTLEGAGVHLHRAFGFGETEPFDPFLLFDDFRNDDPSRFEKGFPWHPHRGIETITYVLAGSVDHADSLGNRGSLGAGDVQWMTAGRGILHQEMPKGDPAGRMHGFQLWANLPSSLKMTEPRYLDVDLPPGTTRTIPVETTRHAFAYVFAGAVRFRGASDPRDVRVEHPHDHGKLLTEYAGNRSLVLFDQGDEIRVEAGEEGGRFLLVSGEPLREPVAWRGPIVMNTQEELEQAWRELREGTFIKE
jgi:redox-sensitive bicupin YhaK (pirin superfamily)